jgi:uncharacterized UBP type Zn finger protein
MQVLIATRILWQQDNWGENFSEMEAVYVLGAGLQNMGNTCYMNDTLHFVTYTTLLPKYMLTQEDSQNCSQHRTCTMCTLQAHMMRALHHSREVILNTSRKLPMSL